VRAAPIDVLFVGHNTLREILRDVYKDNRTHFDTMYKFGFLRNPWDRAVSWFYHEHRNDMTLPPDSLQYHVERFRTWLLTSEASTKFFTGMGCAEKILSDGDQLGVNFLGRFENLAEDYATIMKQIGMPDEYQEIPHKNFRMEKPTVHYSLFYDDECREWIEDLCVWDVNMGAYEFEEVD
jgi:hypothetical protein